MLIFSASTQKLVEAAGSTIPARLTSPSKPKESQLVWSRFFCYYAETVRKRWKHNEAQSETAFLQQRWPEATWASTQKLLETAGSTSLSKLSQATSTQCSRTSLLSFSVTAAAPIRALPVAEMHLSAGSSHICGKYQWVAKNPQPSRCYCSSYLRLIYKPLCCTSQTVTTPGKEVPFTLPTPSQHHASVNHFAWSFLLLFLLLPLLRLSLCFCLVLFLFCFSQEFKISSRQLPRSLHIRTSRYELTTRRTWTLPYLDQPLLVSLRCFGLFAVVFDCLPTNYYATAQVVQIWLMPSAALHVALSTSSLPPPRWPGIGCLQSKFRCSREETWTHEGGENWYNFRYPFWCARNGPLFHPAVVVLLSWASAFQWSIQCLDGRVLWSWSPVDPGLNICIWTTRKHRGSLPQSRQTICNNRWALPTKGFQWLGWHICLTRQQSYVLKGMIPIFSQDNVFDGAANKR